ncbi:hypothetical protein NPIL_627011 [Nephila pilipes]|uniref:Uncharacterized protein n=1 Tax=Nephila pilipes TaxID=299642 RepID=A0A8X6MWY4_NEPPI|nr:hypothetical protein NPIL_627011 [Nephila pilipes]
MSPQSIRLVRRGSCGGLTGMMINEMKSDDPIQPGSDPGSLKLDPADQKGLTTVWINGVGEWRGLPRTYKGVWGSRRWRYRLSVADFCASSSRSPGLKRYPLEIIMRRSITY